MTETTPTIDAMVEDPERHFASPADVLSAPGLSSGDKDRILANWELDARRLAESEAENMGGGETSRLDEVVAARAQLGGSSST